jgi:hypothetical protein
LENEENFQKMSENGIQLIRIWLSQWGIFPSAWNPWNAIEPEKHAQYIPRTGLAYWVAHPESELSMELVWDHSWFSSCMFLGFMKASPAVKRNTDYRVKVRYKAFSLDGPRIAGQPYGFAAKTGGWLWSEGNYCYDSGVGNVIAATYPGSWQNYPDEVDPSWYILEGTLNTGNDDFLPYFYLALENVTAGTVHVDEVLIEEDFGNGTYGPNIISKPDMDHHLYMEQRNSYAFDKVVELAEEHGVYLRPVILEKNEWIFNSIADDGNFTNEASNNNLYGSGRTVTKARWLQQAWWQYLQARWGYSTNIHSWELLNEGDPWNGRHYTLADEFGKYMHQFKPNDHLVSTSNWHSFPKDDFWANPDYPDVDFADYHRYIGESDSSFADAAQATYDVSIQYGASQPGGVGKPVIRGETGFVVSGSGPPTDHLQNDTEGVWLHNFIWGGINAGGLIESYWYENAHIYGQDFDHRHHYGAYYNFIKDIPLNNGNYQDAEAVVSNSNEELRAWGQKDLSNSRAHLWIQNKGHTWKNVVDGIPIPAVSGTVEVSGFQPGERCTVEWWDTYQPDKALQIMRTDTSVARVDGSIAISVDNLTTDVAIRIIAALEGDVNCDCRVDIVDIMLVASHWNTSMDDPDYDPIYDMDSDGDVDIVDIMAVAAHWGNAC